MTHQPTSISKRGASPVGGAGKGRISAKLRQAIQLIAKEGKKQREVCEIVGMHESSLSKALAKPHVATALEQEKARFFDSQQAMRKTYKARALEVAYELMESAASEAVRMRAVEFLAGETQQGPAVSVTINNGGGYEFRHPGQRIVEIEGSATDMASGDQGEDTPAIAGPMRDVGSSE